MVLGTTGLPVGLHPWGFVKEGIFLTKQKILGYSTPDAQAGDQGYENDSQENL
jgi:hypothetical protein